MKAGTKLPLMPGIQLPNISVTRISQEGSPPLADQMSDYKTQELRIKPQCRRSHILPSP